MGLHPHGATHQGHVRPQNEDSLHVGKWVFAVADGVGGGPAGEVASRIAADHVAAIEEAAPSSAQEALEALVSAFGEAARAIGEDASANPDRAGMATTLTAAAVHDGELVVAHVGDSRAYLLSEGGLERLTEDHTPVEEAVRAGIIDESEASRHPERHVLVRVLSSDPQVAVAQSPPRRFGRGDRLLLCSDGLTETCGDDLLAEVLAEAPDPQAATDQLVSAALERGGPDNVTVVVVAVD